jgi:cytochrome c peroxidase
MMLPTDIALLHDPIFKEYVEIFAQDEKEFFVTFALAYGKVCLSVLI